MDLTVTEEDDSWRCVFVLLCLLGSSLPVQWLVIAPTAIAQTCTQKKPRQRLHSKMSASHCTLCLYIHHFFFMSVMHKCPCQLLLFAKGSFENVKEEDDDSWRCLLG